ncbi:MAG: metal ABC transporter permease [Chlamydiae bacterium CG10_big_fil_rev_8_21_14_0_10_35_9]|nr:MAG: metal ABC transporter permease [Chlamydiae bacterium CG10_big_fil_rev_8_21_14_0_10_35_9]
MLSLNPYWGVNFFGFLWTFISRIPLLISGNCQMVQDELQIFVLSLMAISCSLIGVVMMLKKTTMLANSLSHTILVGIVIAYLLSFSSQGGFHPFSLSIKTFIIAALISALITTFLSEFLTKSLKLQEDASIGLVFTFLFSLGIVAVTVFSRNAHIGTEVVMGNVDALVSKDLLWLLFIAAVNISLFILCYKEYLLTTFDPVFAKFMKISTTFFSYLLMLQLSITVIGSFRIVGVIMVLSYIIGPALLARLFFHQFTKLLLFAPLFGIVISIIGVALTRHFLSMYQMPLSTAGMCIAVLAVSYFLALIIKKRKKSWQLPSLDQQDQSEKAL